MMLEDQCVYDDIVIYSFHTQSCVLISPGDHLGLMIRGGAEFGLGIFVSGVLHNSVAWKLGLKVRI